MTPGAATLPLLASVWSVGEDHCLLFKRLLREQPEAKREVPGSESDAEKTFSQ